MPCNVSPVKQSLKPDGMDRDMSFVCFWKLGQIVSIFFFESKFDQLGFVGFSSCIQHILHAPNTKLLKQCWVC